jgi:chromosomal replication initiation ATPase DnaA
MLKACKEEKQSMYESGYWIIGSPKFIKDALRQDKDKRVRMANYVRINWDHDRLAEFVFSRVPVSIDDIKRRGRNNVISDARKLYCYFAITILEMKTINTAERLNVTSTAVCRLARQGKRIAENRGIELPIH